MFGLMKGDNLGISTNFDLCETFIFSISTNIGLLRQIIIKLSVQIKAPQNKKVIYEVKCCSNQQLTGFFFKKGKLWRGD